MSDIPGSANRIQYEAVQYRSAVSESSLQAIGALANHLRDHVLPVGSVVQSLLSEAAYQSEVGNTNWILADGRDVTGSRFASLFGSNNVPDMRGVVLRGKNNGRSTTTGNTEGDLSLGAYQADKVLEHSHNYLRWAEEQRMEGTWRPFSTIRLDVTYPATTYGVNAPEYATENRVRNVTVNHFIRIN